MNHFSTDERRKVLIVDDDPDFPRILAHFMQKAGYTVGMAASGMDGIRKFHRETWDVVITDRSMPQMDGEQMTEVLKAMRIEVPVVLVTGLPDGIRHPDLFEAILTKPFRQTDLLAVLENALEKHPPLALAS